MEKGFFITGTDTNVGKTWTTLALLRYFNRQGKSTLGMKPVASGCFLQQGRPVNEDALLIQQQASVKADYELVNPYAFFAPVSPHIAGKQNPVSLDKVMTCFNQLQGLAEVIIVEGAGGWYSPLNDQADNADLAKSLALPVILVVAVRLGCINHAKLTYSAIRQSRLDYAGWIAVCSDPDVLNGEEIIDCLKKAVDSPLLGILPYRQTADFDFFAQQLSL